MFNIEYGGIFFPLMYRIHRGEQRAIYLVDTNLLYMFSVANCFILIIPICCNSIDVFINLLDIIYFFILKLTSLFKLVIYD